MTDEASDELPLAVFLDPEGAKKSRASGDAIELHEVREENGEISLQHATALHALGGSLYELGRFEELLEMSKVIVRIHEQLEGPEKCEQAMLRMLYILVKDYGVNSKEVLLHRSRMLTLMIRHAEMSIGMSYEKYLENVDDEL
ncbi:hypothetical protein B484DRAFT_403539 [Ochromonadaceae sp. CCMP2298]|nr:hypothetical protein B484DRAFT_403539 [Ochromonadaceae sp. CCMP2298]